MTSKKNAEEIFSKAVELTDSEEQAAYLEQACGGDEKLRAQVETLLKWHTEAGDFLEVPVVDPDVTLETSAVTEGSGAVIGRYKLLERIGEGGMATVYMAEQKRPLRRRVALKIIKLGMDTKQVIARFEAERQALAMMDHPNIAKVLDAGATETGRPYFVMELVRGVPITEFCDSNHLIPRERLELFISVCQAVQHAHQKGIIHRDIKPTNILVTLHDGEPVVKVIDFGIAKAVNQQLTEKTVFTRYSQMIGTPEYMSPEQAEMSGLDIDTRADVFSLGVLLYELLTGTTPFDSEYLLSKGYGEMQRIIREEEPTRPSTKLSTLGEALTEIAKHRHTSPELLCKLIRTDLDWIVMKSLEKDRTRRYESVSELAADVKRHLKDEPVLAGRPSTLYRIRKFARRRRALVGAVAAVAAAIVVGFVVSTTMYLRADKALRKEAIARSEAETARNEAEQQAETLKTLAPFYDWDISIASQGGIGRDFPLAAGLHEAAIEFERTFKGPALLEAKGCAYFGITLLLLGEHRAADRYLAKALKIRQAELGPGDPVTLISMANLAILRMHQEDFEQATALLVEAVETSRMELDESHDAYRYVRNCIGRLLKAMTLYGVGRYRQGEYETAVSALYRADQLRETVFRASSRALDTGYTAMSLHKLGRERQASEALARLRQLLSSGMTVRRSDEILRYEVEMCFVPENSRPGLFWSAMASSDLEDAARILAVLKSEASQEDRASVADLDTARNALARGFYLCGRDIFRREGDIPRVVSCYRRAIQRDPTLAVALKDLALLQASCSLDVCRDGDEAVKAATKACAIVGWDEPDFLGTLAAAYAQANDYDSAIAWQQKAIASLPDGKKSGLGEDMKARLALYESKTPHRMKWAGALVAHWRFDEREGRVAGDFSGNALDGVLQGDATWEVGRVGGGLLFDGDGDYVECGDSALFDIRDEITVAAWIKVSGFSGFCQTVIAKGPQSWRLQRFWRTHLIEFSCEGVNAETNSFGCVVGNTRVDDGQWHHVAGTYDGSRLSLYIDGRLDNFEFAFGGKIALNDRDVRIGDTTDQLYKGARYWSGLIDDVRIYNQALTEAEIKVLYTGDGRTTIDR